jgi:uncharacterized protein
MRIKRFNNIVAFANSEDPHIEDEFFAYHFENMEIASISKEAFDSLNDISFADPVSQMSQTNAHLAIKCWDEEQNLEAKTSKLNYRIRTISLNVNQICNLKCSYCAASGDGTYGRPTKEIDTNATKKQLRFLISKLKDNDSFNINFVGGEPLLHPNIICEIYDYVFNLAQTYDFRPYFRIVTNGTLLNENTIHLLFSRKFEINISLDGDKPVNDKIRPSKDGHSTTEKITAGLNLIKKNNFDLSYLSASIITSADNTKLFNNFKFVESLGLNTFEFAFENNESNEYVIYEYISEYKKVLEYLWKKDGEAGIRKIITVNHYFKLLDAQTRIENHCGAGKSYLMIDSKNGAFNCVWEANYLDRKVGDGTDIKPTEGKLLKPLIEINNCLDCWAKYLCGGGCMYINELHTGNKHLKSKAFCLRTRLLISLVIMYYKRARQLSNSSEEK